MKQYIIPIVSSLIVWVSVYALSSENDPSVLIEKENQAKIIECLEKVYTQTWSQDMKKQIKFCESLPLITIWTGLLAPSSEPPSQINSNSNLDILHSRVCKKQINSPLCKDRILFDRLYQLTEERLPWKNFYPILLGITNAESSLGLAYAKDKVGWTCHGRNNLWWIKWKINDDGSRQKDQSIPDQYWCYLYKFDSIEDYWISKVNTVRFGYKWCVDHTTPIRCMSFAYVWDRNTAEESWIKNVSVFLY